MPVETLRPLAPGAPIPPVELANGPGETFTPARTHP